MTTQTIEPSANPSAAPSKADKAFRKLTGHYPSECARGCYRPKGRGEKRVEVHRNSLERPGVMAGQPFTETWEERIARKAAKRAALLNGPVRIVRPAPEATAD